MSNQSCLAYKRHNNRWILSDGPLSALGRLDERILQEVNCNPYSLLHRQ